MVWSHARVQCSKMLYIFGLPIKHRVTTPVAPKNLNLSLVNLTVPQAVLLSTRPALVVNYLIPMLGPRLRTLLHCRLQWAKPGHHADQHVCKPACSGCTQAFCLKLACLNMHASCSRLVVGFLGRLPHSREWRLPN